MRHLLHLLLASGIFAPATLAAVETAPEAGGQAPAEGRDPRSELRAVNALLKQAEEKAALGEPEAAQAKYEAALSKFGKGPGRFLINLHFGRFWMEGKQFDKALGHFQRAASDGGGRADVNPDLEQRTEALFSTGMCFVRLGETDRCFPSFRQVVELAPGSDWANQAYFQIGEAHVARGNFTQAIANFQLVGTSLTGEQLGQQRAELGRPLTVRIQDRDLLVRPENRPLTVQITSSDGDKETATLRPIRPGSETSIGTLPTALGAAVPGDGVVQGTGATTVEVAYTDEQTADGKLNAAKTQRLVLASDARAAFTDGAYRDAVSQVVFNDAGAGDVNLRVVDFDQDRGDAADRVEVEIVVESPVLASDAEEGKEAKEGAAKDDPAKKPEPAATKAPDGAGDEVTWVERRKLAVVLSEIPEPRRDEQDGISGKAAAPAAGGTVRSGYFAATVRLGADTAKAGAQGLQVSLKDRLTLRYKDARTVASDTPVVRNAEATVVAGTTSTLNVAQSQIDDANLRVRKELLSGEASLRIGEVYRDMGLESHAQQRFDEAVGACDRVMQSTDTYDKALHEQTLYTLWRVYLAKGDLRSAAGACQLLQSQFPDSQYIADSLIAMAKAAEGLEQPWQAIQLLQQVAAMPKAADKAPEALFHIGEVYEGQIEKIDNGRKVVDAGARQQAVNAFRKVFTAYPDSPRAGDALKRIGDYYIADGNWSQAIDFFEQILHDYPDAPYIADVLHNIAQARAQRGDTKGALTALARLEREFPGYERADKARSLRQKLERSAAKPDASTQPAPAAAPAAVTK